MSASSAVAQHGERKLAVLMFADLTGYTELCRRLDPEDVVATVRPVMAALQQAATNAGGVICSTAGDGFMAVFGVPVALEDAADRAISAATAMHQAVRDRNAQPGPTRVPQVHIGVAAGEVFVAPSDEPLGWALVGSAVNLASRLCDAAGPSQTLVDERTRELIGATGAWGAPESIDIRGHDAPVTAWPLLAAAPPDIEGPAALPFFDRTELLAELNRSTSEAITQARVRIVQLEGESGIGKSRLADEWLANSPVTLSSIWLNCSGRVGEDQLVELLQELARLADEADFEPRLQQLLSSAGVGAMLRTDPFPALMAMLRQLLESAASADPVAIVIDDVHAASATLVAALSDIAAEPPAARAVFVITRRTGEGPDMTPAVPLRVTALPDSDAERLLAAALGGDPSSNLRDLVLPRVQGHPLMTVQSAAFLRESGTVRVGDGRCEITDHAKATALPTSLRLSVAARLDRLPAEEKAALLELSSCGDVAGHDDITALGLAGSPVLTALERRGLLIPTTSGLRFAHGLVREVAYASLPRGVRSRLHRDHLGRLPTRGNSARRLFHALAWADAATPTDEVESRLADSAALREGLAHAESQFRLQAEAAHATIRRLLPLLEDRASVAPDEAAGLLTIRAHCLIEAWRFDEALLSAENAVKICRQYSAKPTSLLTAMLAQGAALSRLRRYHAARQVLDEVHELARANGDEAARANALALLAGTWRIESWPSFLTLTEEAHDAFRDSGDVEGAGACARMLYYLLSYSTTSRLAKWYQAARECTNVNDIRGMAWLRRADAMGAVCRLELGRARAAAESAVELGTTVGALDIIGDGLSVLVEVAGATGDHETARRRFEELRKLASSTANPRTRLVAANCSALSLLRSGALDECREELRLAQEAAAEYGPTEKFDVDTARALVARDQGDWSTALGALASAREAADQGPFAVWGLGLAAQQARVLTAIGQAPSQASLAHLAADCRDAGAAVIAQYVDSVAIQAYEAEPRVLSSDANSAVHPEIRAMRADARALYAERAGRDAVPPWRDAVDAWKPLGVTIFLARAQARSGQPDEAAATLNAIGAEEAARAWACAG